jgi:hypothetical protein
MKAEIGFVEVRDRNGAWTLTDRLKIVITPVTPTEQSMLAVWAKRMGFELDAWYGDATIEEPKKEDKT